MRSSKRAAFAAGLLGFLAIATIPLAVLAAQELASVGLLQALYVAVPIAIILGLAAVLVARRARLWSTRSVFRGSSHRFAQIVAWAGLLCGLTGGIALAVYGALRWASTG
jgi:hypothetical protein